MTQPTNDKIYDLVNSVRLELKNDIAVTGTSLANNQGRLEKKFDDLEAGRLTHIESRYNDLALRVSEFEGVQNAKSAGINVKLAILWFILMTIGVAIINVFTSKFIN